MRRQSDIATIKRYLDELSVFRARQKVDTTSIIRAYERQDFAGMLGEIRDALGLVCRFRIGKVKSGGPRTAAAWVVLPERMPLSLTNEFRKMQLTVYVRNEHLWSHNFESLVAMMAHECSHVLLESTWHPLRHEERAVDLTAMLFGFSEFFLSVQTAHQKGWRLGWNPFRFFRKPSLPPEDIMFGYLTPTEVTYAHGVILKMRRKK